MQAMRKRLTYANVVSTLALFLVVAGGAAIAAKVPKKSVGPSQLKANAVTTAKIKANAVTTRKIKRNAVANAKIKDGAVEGAKVADGSITADDIDEAATPFSRVVLKARGSSALALTEEAKLYPLGNAAYTQAATENDAFIGAVDVTFSAACTAPRAATAQVVLDAPDPLKPAEADIVAQGTLKDDSGIGNLSRRIELGAFGGVTSSRFEPGSAKNRKISLIVFGSCAAGSGINVNFGAVNVIGTK